MSGERVRGGGGEAGYRERRTSRQKAIDRWVDGLYAINCGRNLLESRHATLEFFTRRSVTDELKGSR